MFREALELAESNLTTAIGIMLYWVPLIFCVIFYTVRTGVNYSNDRVKREKPGPDSYGIYYPTDTVGDLIGRALASVVPVANLWASLFDLGPKVFGKFFKWLGKVFDQPLVPDSQAYLAKRRPLNV